MSVLTAEEPITDAAGDIFDPELHATKPDGSPSVKTDGTFRKKRRDAGGARPAASTTSTRSKSTSSAGGSKVLAAQRDRHAKGLRDLFAIPTAVLSFVDPVDAYCASELAPPLADALADYAQENPQLAAVLDKLANAGGLSAVLAVVMVGGVQFAHNHGKIPEQYARMMGARPRREIEAILRQRGEAMAQHAEQAAAA